MSRKHILIIALLLAVQMHSTPAVGGQFNCIGVPNAAETADFNFIGGGFANCVLIGGGFNSNFNMIGGGNSNCIIPGTNYASIFGGQQNLVNGNYSMIGDGLQNGIGGTTAASDLPAEYSFIGGGSGNCISSNAVVTTNYGTIGGGQSNCIFPGTNHSSIFGGRNDCILDNCASILGGLGNTVSAGFPNAHIVGSGIVLSATVGNPNSLHVNGLWANNIPNNPLVALPVGTVFSMPNGTTPPFWAYPTTSVLWIA